MAEARNLRVRSRVNTLEVGTLFAERYEILAELARGGMGRVYRARHTGLAREVALKILATAPTGVAGPRSAADRSAQVTGDYEARFSREARAVARLDHPGCVRILDHGRAGGMPYIAMELLDGETLRAVLDRGRFAPADAISIARQLLLALAHAHASGVIHRDLKPENVVLVRGGKRAVLVDFGLASLAGEQPLTGSGMCLGSPSYLAPERLLGQPHDARTDLYSVGVLLYEMLAGQKPFVGDSPQETMRLALQRPPRPLRAVCRDIPPVLDQVIQRALAKDPARRFTDAEHMLLALGDAEDAARRRVAEECADAAATQTIARLDVREPSWLARVWARLRYGTWRWRRA
jgi:eukaryotic-like serine/threonine-protein kinase